MTLRTLFSLIAAISIAIGLVGCASNPLPKYEPPLAKTPLQSVRTTAYTWTEEDHILYGKCNALGGQLCIAPPSKAERRHARKERNRNSAPPEQIRWNSAAADWSRWPVGTLFRLTSNGQYFRIDDYGWALAGRNTIDLCMPSRRVMNLWGVRQETIQILRWGDRAESFKILRRSTKFRHIQRMVFEFENRPRDAAKLK